MGRVLSKLDDIVSSIGLTHRLVGEMPSDEVIKQQITDLMLELIGEAQDEVAHDNRDTVYGFSMLSSKLRQKVSEL